MINCTRCGRPIPEGTFADNLCPECHQKAYASAGPPGTVVGPPPVVVQRRVLPQPAVTKALVAVNVAVFLLMLLSGASLMAPSSQYLLRFGADFGPLTLDGQLWRILTSNYVHIGLLHIFFNMWCLWNLGPLAERILGPWAYLLTYTACGIAGSLASLWIHPVAIGAGASGAIFGLAGALITALYLGKLPYPGQMLRGLMRSLLSFAGYNLFFGAVVPGIDNSAHIGGLLTGLALGALLAPLLHEGPDQRRAHERFIFLGAAVFLVAFGMFVKQQRGWVVEKYRQLAPGIERPQGPNR
ncbi:MAG TPA: rhomboid family intramembrane serine protease [Terriglobales bacterium]|nr:rhomboid family intramembrane serine protease [Terriglobales bacterium]